MRSEAMPRFRRCERLSKALKLGDARRGGTRSVHRAGCAEAKDHWPLAGLQKGAWCGDEWMEKVLNMGVFRIKKNYHGFNVDS